MKKFFSSADTPGIGSDDGVIEPPSRFPLGTLLKVAFPLLVGVVIINDLFYTIPEGHVGVVRRFGEAVQQVTPGLSVKIPFVDQVMEIEIRTRKNVEEKLSVATKEQMPGIAVISVNWSVPASEALEVYRRFGGLDQYESRVLDPRINAAAKEAISRFEAEQIIVNRGAVVAAITDALKKQLEGYTIIMESVQLENIDFPPEYVKAVKDKLVALQDAAREKHTLEKQALQAQQQVNTAHAERDARKARADGVAYETTTIAKAEADSVRMRGEAEALAVAAIQRSLADNHVYVDYVRANKWKGDVPTTMLGENMNVLLGMGNSPGK